MLICVLQWKVTAHERVPTDASALVLICSSVVLKTALSQTKTFESRDRDKIKTKTTEEKNIVCIQRQLI